MDLMRLGAALRAIRVHRRMRLDDLARATGVSRSVIARLERGDGAGTGLRTVDAIARGLGATVDIYVRWRGADLDRLINARHSALHERVAEVFADLSGWVVVPEATFAIYGERGVIDWLAWHPATRTLLIIELKTAIVDLQEMLGTLDRKRRLAPEIARQRGWFPAVVATWLIVEEAPRNRCAVSAHRSLLGRVFTADGHAVRRWLRAPAGAIQALSFLAISRPEAARGKRVRLRGSDRPGSRTNRQAPAPGNASNGA